METLRQSFESPLQPEEEQDAVLSAMLGALDDLHTEFISSGDTRRQDEEIMNAVKGVYSAGAEYTNGDFARTVSMFNEFEARLGAMQAMCNHDHMVADSLGLPSNSEDPQNDEQKNHNEDEDEYEIDPLTGKKRKKKRAWFK